MGPDLQVETIEIACCSRDTIVAVEYAWHDDGRPLLELARKAEGPDAGDGTVPLWSAVLPGAAIYYIQEVHRYLSKTKEVIEATLDLMHGGAPDLPTSAGSSSLRRRPSRWRRTGSGSASRRGPPPPTKLPSSILPIHHDVGRFGTRRTRNWRKPRKKGRDAFRAFRALSQVSRSIRSYHEGPSEIVALLAFPGERDSPARRD